jgi:hypothetical protein
VSQVVTPPLELAVGGQVTPICVIDFSDKLLRAELEFWQHGLFVSMIGTRPMVLANEVAMEVAHVFRSKKVR